MSALDFLSLDLARADGGFAPSLVSPLQRALAHGAPAGVEDVSLATGKLEVRGDVDGLALDGAEVVPTTPERALVLCDYERVGALREELRGRFETVVDVTGALAGLRIDRPDAERLLSRMTGLDLDRIPTTGAVEHVAETIMRDGETAFRLFFAQEYGHTLAEVVLDTVAGLEGATGFGHHGAVA